MIAPEPGPLPTATAGLVRVRIDIAYDGTDFAGWARQREQRTVQGVVEQAFATVLRTRDVALTVAGRTDAGVHASGQVAHIDIASSTWADLGPSLLRRLAGVLPRDVRISALTPVSADFNARFSALWRHYVYRATDDPTGATPLRRHDTVAWPRPLDVARMSRAAEALVGLHDFAAYCRRRDGSTSIRTLERLDLERTGSVITWQVQADAFCYSMVRSLVGALVAVGDGRRPVDWPPSLLARTSRADDVTVAPAHGLTLVAVGYPAESDLAARAAFTRQRRERPSGPQIGRCEG